jgi:pimeloyl-ACP methyl ester carboxylesterase
MPVGMFLRATRPVFADGRSQVGSLDDLQAERLEIVRSEVAPLLDQTGRDHVVVAWTFRTQSVLDPMLEATNKAEELNISPEPSNLEVISPGEALLDFVIGIASLFDVEEVWNGTIKTPVFLDRVTRGFTEDGSHQVEEIAFQLTIPRNWDPAEPLPVVIFGHGLMTERRFVLSQGDFLGRRGFAAIAIDLPYHGTRTFCKRGGPMSIPHPLTGELMDLDPCEAGTTCAADGRCVDGQGQGNALRMWPIIGFPMASGSAFLEMEELAHTRDHFTQALIDLRSLLRALQLADWQSAIGYRFATDRFYYIGQSLGGILGAVFTTISPEVERAVWNVPGCDMVDMFDTSIYFGPQVDAFFQREDVNRTSYEAELFLNVARWIMDAIDPASVAHLMQGSKKLRDISGAPMREYISEHAFLTIPGDPAYLPGVIDAADCIDGVFDQ